MARPERRFSGICRSIFAALALTILAARSPQAAASPASDMVDVYGRGVHAYFANQYSTAEGYLTQVIDAGSTDPRAFYFRAVVRLRSGRQYEAIDDLQLGAAYEARDPGAAGSVGQALTRIQGPDRQLIEQYRRAGRIDRSGQQRILNQARYEQQTTREGEVLRHEKPIGLGELVAPAAGTPSSPATPQPQLAAPLPGPAVQEPAAAAPAAAPAADPFSAAEPVAEATPAAEEPAAA